MQFNYGRRSYISTQRILWAQHAGANHQAHTVCMLPPLPHSFFECLCKSVVHGRRKCKTNRQTNKAKKTVAHFCVDSTLCMPICSLITVKGISFNRSSSSITDAINAVWLVLISHSRRTSDAKRRSDVMAVVVKVTKWKFNFANDRVSHIENLNYTEIWWVSPHFGCHGGPRRVQETR